MPVGRPARPRGLACTADGRALGYEGMAVRSRRRGSMPLSRGRNRLSIALSSIPMALAILLLTPTPTLALGDWIGVEAGFWNQGQDGNASIDGSFFNGTTVDFQDTLDLDKTD